MEELRKSTRISSLTVGVENRFVIAARKLPLQMLDSVIDVWPE